MEYKIITMPAMRLAGISYTGANQHGEIPAMWNVFLQRLDEIERVDQEVCYGLEFFDHEVTAKGEFEYITCTQVAENFILPTGIIERRVPASDYAVFKHIGDPSGIHQTFQKIYRDILPTTGLKLREPNFDMEVYNKDFMPVEGESSVVYIYIAVEEPE